MFGVIVSQVVFNVIIICLFMWLWWRMDHHIDTHKKVQEALQNGEKIILDLTKD